MKIYTVTLGNIELRPGHRHDCAQVEVSVTVAADDAKGAVEQVRQMAANYPATRALARYPKTGFHLRFNPETITARSVRVEERTQ